MSMHEGNKLKHRVSHVVFNPIYKRYIMGELGSLTIECAPAHLHPLKAKANVAVKVDPRHEHCYLHNSFWRKMQYRFILGLLPLIASSIVVAQEDLAVVESAVKSLGIEGHLRNMADQGNKSAPYMIDKETQYASAVASGKRLTTQWVFIKRQKVEIDVGALKQGMTEQGLTRLCTNPVTRMLIDRYDATLNHTYSDKTGAFLFSFNGNRAACKSFKV